MWFMVVFFAAGGVVGVTQQTALFSSFHFCS